MKNNEPTLKKIEDYNTLKGSKKRTVWIVILVGLILGALIVGANMYYGAANDTIDVQGDIGKIPVK